MPNLDEYLAELGISEQDETVAAPLSHEAVGRGAAGHDAAGNGTAGNGAAAEPAFGPTDPQATFERFLQQAVRYLGDYTVAVRRNDTEDAQVLEAEILGEKAAKLAGQGGEVLHALETLAYAVLSKRGGPTDIKLRIDAGGYRQRQIATLDALAQRLAAQVSKTGEAHTLQPMTPTERRIIHMSLKDHPLVTTVSQGEGKGRHLVITPR